jgi:hypothetical protein
MIAECRQRGLLTSCKEEQAMVKNEPHMACIWVFIGHRVKDKKGLGYFLYSDARPIT